MSVRITGGERRRAPKAFQDQLTRKFGRNPYGDPNYLIVWGQTQTIRLGNIVHGRTGYRPRLVQHNMPCWVIMRWRAPKEYGTPESYYMETYDAMTKLYITGEYPFMGRYEILQPLYHKRFEGGKVVIDAMPLDQILIDRVVPMICKAQRMSYWERKAAQDYVREQEEKKATEEIAEKLAEALPRWYGPVSYSRQGTRTSLLDRKMHEIQQVWNRYAGTKFNIGFGQGRKSMVKE